MALAVLQLIACMLVVVGCCQLVIFRLSSFVWVSTRLPSVRWLACIRTMG